METKRLRSARAVCVVLLVSVGNAWANADSLYTPGPIVVPDGKSLERVKTDVHKALLDKDWQVRHPRSGRIEAKLIDIGKADSVRAAVIYINYDAKIVTIAYKDSRGLNYNKPKNEIDRQYTRWVRALEKNIKKSLASY